MLIDYWLIFDLFSGDLTDYKGQMINICRVGTMFYWSKQVDFWLITKHEIENLNIRIYRGLNLHSKTRLIMKHEIENLNTLWTISIHFWTISMSKIQVYDNCWLTITGRSLKVRSETVVTRSWITTGVRYKIVSFSGQLNLEWHNFSDQRSWNTS